MKIGLSIELTLLLSDKLNVPLTGEAKRQRSPETIQLHDEIRQSLSKKQAGGAASTGMPGPAAAEQPRTN
ncbi:MAG: hypothetical protein P4L50_04470 [Anaerolineaceae bacterium]|nr:hypothetical protein [Anaerolineaceae bacterium]